MRILFLNQYFPPDPAPTGVLLREVADALAGEGHDVDFVSAGQPYRDGKRNGGRMKREVIALARMLFAGLRRRRADVVFSLSSPPCIVVVATLLAFWHRAKSVHWVMDLYPDIATALGEIEKSRVTDGIRALMGWCCRRASLVAGLDEDMAERLREDGVEPRVMRPWVCGPLANAPASAISPQEPWTWMYSGNLGRAHEWETLLAAQAELERRGSDARLVFQGGGPSWPAAQARAQELSLRQCDWLDYAPEDRLRESLLRAACLVATERPEVRGLLWPSKLALMLTLPRPILFIGPADGAIARMLGGVPHAAVFPPGGAKEAADWLEQQRRHPQSIPESGIADAGVCRTESLRVWCAWIEALGPR